jgi:glycosyltransferase involved in cell wall biosynthesis
MRVGVFIPAYNAERTLTAVFERLLAAKVESLEGIWIIDDGSTDGTARVAEEIARRCSLVTVVHGARNGGYGAAVKQGLRALRQAAVEQAVCLHADGQYAPELLPSLLRALCQEQLDLLQGSRIAAGTALSGGMPLYKYLAGRGLTALENRVFHLHLTDYHSGYLLYGPRALYDLDVTPLSDSFDFDLEVIAMARAADLRIGERPIPTHYGDEVSHLNSIAYGFRVLNVLLRYKLGRYSASSSSSA